MVISQDSGVALAAGLLWHFLESTNKSDIQSEICSFLKLETVVLIVEVAKAAASMTSEVKLVPD